MVLFGCVNYLKISTRIVNLGLSIVIVWSLYIWLRHVCKPRWVFQWGCSWVTNNEIAQCYRLEVISHTMAVQLVLSSLLISWQCFIVCCWTCRNGPLLYVRRCPGKVVLLEHILRMLLEHHSSQKIKGCSVFIYILFPWLLTWCYFPFRFYFFVGRAGFELWVDVLLFSLCWLYISPLWWRVVFFEPLLICKICQVDVAVDLQEHVYRTVARLLLNVGG